MNAEVILPNDKSFLRMKIIEESMDAHSKRIACAFARWISDTQAEGNAEELYDQFIQSINKTT